MKYPFISVAALFAALPLLFSCGSGDSASFVRVDPLEKLLPEMTWNRPFDEMEEVAAGEHATFQFALRGSAGLKDVTVSVEAPRDSAGNSLDDVTTGFVEYVHVGRTTPTQGRDAIRSVSGMYPDPIIDDGKAMDIPMGKTQPVRVGVAVPNDAAPGVYKGKVKVKGKGFRCEEEIAIKVYPVVLEEPSLWVTNWFNPGERGAQYFNPEASLYSDEYWDYLRALTGKMKECYQNTVLIQLSCVDSRLEGDTWSFDFTNFDRMVDLFMEAGVLKRLEVGHLGGRIGSWESPFGIRVPNAGTLPLDDPRAKSYFSQFVPALVSHIKEKGWYPIYCQHIADEPAWDNFGSYVEIARSFKEIAPDAKIIEACHSHDLADVVDIWVPQLDLYSSGYSFYEERQKAGDEVWFYTCLGPQGNFANRFLEQPLLKTRLLHWINFRFGATGYLHWGLNYWGVDPWKETTAINQEWGNILPGGDSWIIYPGDKRIYGSIRLEAMRDGIADYTLLQMLSRKDEALAKEICRQTVYGWDVYDMSTDHVRKARHQILEALSE
ncbi:MAG: DUF4091 domain-containing protein [Bacteroidales bacterium]|nr:DUF4091 domain-containing protein [Bacteroidales bacterium]